MALGDRLSAPLIFDVFPHRRRAPRGARRVRRLPAPGLLRPLARVAPPWIERSVAAGTCPAPGPASRSSRGASRASSSATSTPRRRACSPPTGSTCTSRGRRAAAARCTRTPAGSTKGSPGRACSSGSPAPGYDAIVTNAAGCGSHLKDHCGAARFVDVWSCSPRSAPAPATRHPLADPRRVPGLVPPQACAAHRRRAAGRTARDPGPLDLEPGEQELCCGSAGIYNLVQPRRGPRARRPEGRTRARDVARRLRERQPRLPRPGDGRAAPRGSPAAAFHPIELVDASIRGLSADEVLSRARS